jgi:tryptophanyl-tRNA synthetase
LAQPGLFYSFKKTLIFVTIFTMSKERLLTGLQPSGQLHIGNYFGALKPFVDSYEKYDSFLLIVDYHALTSLRSPEELKKNTLSIAMDYVAAGVDPKRVTMFVQSAVPQHLELAWVFECLVTVPFLMQAHAYKDKIAKGLEANAGLFNYPMLMAADILLYDAKNIPVGEDQQQHVEYAREVASKFNNAYGQTFDPPKELIFKDVGTVPGTDGQKMSKSYKNTIPLFGTKDEISKAVMGIVTDSSGDKPENVYAIHKLYKEKSELNALYEENKGNYKTLKEALVEDIEKHVAPMRENREVLEKDKAGVEEILKEGSEKAREIAEERMKDIRAKIGIEVY